MLGLRSSKTKIETQRARARDEQHGFYRRQYAHVLRRIRAGYDYDDYGRHLANEKGLDVSSVDAALRTGAASREMRETKKRERAENTLHIDYEKAREMLERNWPNAPEYRKAADRSTMIGTGDLLMQYGIAVRNIAHNRPIKYGSSGYSDKSWQLAYDRFNLLCDRITEGEFNVIELQSLGTIEEAIALEYYYGHMNLSHLWHSIHEHAGDEYRRGQKIIAHERDRR